ncbi:MAG: hypothetical protein HY675_07290 [Chloroflexi bacterium]|nr:hypothetical protein [Chloroflexota bacterium]
METTRPARESQVAMSQVMGPGDANPVGSVHGGTIMKMVDTAAAVAAIKHSRKRVVTARIDSMSFLAPVRVGNLVTVKASVNDVGRSSMEVGVRVEAEDLTSDTSTHVSSAYLVFVALDDNGRPAPVPRLIAETEAERQRMAEARVRREYRSREMEVIRVYRRPETRKGRQVVCPTRGLLCIVGHRGAMGHAPENTMVSFQKAVEMGASIIELDVHLSKDGELIVMHDHAVDRTTDGRGLIKDLTLKEIKALDAGSWYGAPFKDQHVPTLGEMLSWAKGKVRVAIEIKNGPVYYDGIEDKVVRCLRKHRMENEALTISFDHYAVRRVKELAPESSTGVLFAARPVDPVGMAAAADADAILPQWGFATAEMVAAAHDAGLAVVPWVVNTESEMECVVGLGVDGIGTNYPDRLREYIARHAQSGGRTGEQ